MFRGPASSWNLRDRHMADTLDALGDHLDRHGEPREDRRLGAQLPRRRRARHRDGPPRRAQRRPARPRAAWPDDAVLVGFTTYDGTVTAASDWDAPAERKRVRPALAGELRGALPRRRRARASVLDLARPAPRRSAGASHASSGRSASSTGPRPSARATTSTRASPTSSTRCVHFDETRAVEPLERTAGWERGEAPETFPSGV